MLKIVGTEHGKVVDEKVLLDDNNKPTKFLWFLVGCELLLDAGIFCILMAIFHKKKDSTDII